jgi:hypothetical protein
MTSLGEYKGPIFVNFTFYEHYIKLIEIPNIKKIKSLLVNKTDDTHFTIIINIDDYDLFNLIISKCAINVSTIFEILPIVHTYFEDYDPNDFIIRRIQSYLLSFSKKIDYIWQDITSKTDYNLVLFRKRKLPFYNIQCKEWVKINIDVHHNEGYDPDAESPEADYDNNYMSWPVLPLNNDVDQIIRRIETIMSFKLHNIALEFVLRALIHPRFCHIIKSHYILNMINNNMQTHNLIIKYCMTYAMYILRQEETISFSKVSDKSRFIFDLETASRWPVFDHVALSQSPYAIQLTDGIIDKSVPLYLKGVRRIASASEFNRRFRLATGGAFDGIDFKKLKAVVCGSILIPCVHISPLEESPIATNKPLRSKRKNVYMTDYTNDDIPFLNYLEYYYPGYVSLYENEYNDEITPPFTENVDDIKYEADEAEEMSADIPIYKNTNVLYNKMADIDVAITTNRFAAFKDTAKLIYDQVVKNCKHRGAVYIREEHSATNVKFKIYGPGLPRPFDIFKTYKTPDKLVKLFHLSAVRMYYDGQVMLFRSCITSLLSGVCESYKIHSCKKVPADILLKYMNRGITNVLNKSEIRSVATYARTNERWRFLFNHLVKFCNGINANHPFFSSGMGIRSGLVSNHEKKQVDSIKTDNIISNPVYSYKFGSLQTNDNTHMIPPDINVIRTAIDYISASK